MTFTELQKHAPDVIKRWKDNAKEATEAGDKISAKWWLSMAKDYAEKMETV